MSGSRVTLRSVFVAATALASLAIFSAAPAHGEDTCVADAPHEPAAIRGLTWTGTVVGIKKDRVDDVGIEHWTIDFAVDHVYAHDPDRDFPKGATLAAGEAFALPSDTCGRRGDMGLTVGGRYLVSAGFVTDQGSSLGNLAIWALDGERPTIVPGLYETSFVSPAITGVRTLGEALTLLGIEHPQSTALPSPAAPSNQADWGLPLLAAVASAAVVWLVALRRLRSRSPRTASHDIPKR